MTKKLLSVTVRGDNHTWTFNFVGDTRYLDDWRSDGLEIDEIENIIPEWVVYYGLTKVWCKLQDWFNFKFWRR